MQLSMTDSLKTSQEVTASATAASWIQFVRQYGPIPRNDSAYEERIKKAARRAGLTPVLFKHPLQDDVLHCFHESIQLRSVILTGDAGDGKTHLCHRVWQLVGGDDTLRDSDAPYLYHELADGSVLHVIRDLSAWVPAPGASWDAHKAELLIRFSQSIFSDQRGEYFLLAGNTGQLLETWKRLPHHTDAKRALALFEEMLVDGKQQAPNVNLSFFNLSRNSSADLYEACVQAFLNHPGWQLCFTGESKHTAAFSEQSPIYVNYHRLKGKLLQARLRSLFELCDYNNVHIPIREILALLANAILGHPDVKDRLMMVSDVETILKNNTSSKASIYDNLFGVNLTESRRESIGVFSALNRFRIGEETSNRIDNLLIFGNTDDHLIPYFNQYVASDPVYGASQRYLTEQTIYIEGAGDEDDRSKGFLPLLASQRRALFFKIEEEQTSELRLWELTVFSYAGEYLRKLVGPLQEGKLSIDRDLVGRLVKGLNRVFVGMLVSSENDLYLGTSLQSTGAKVSRVYEDNIPVRPKNGQFIKIEWHNHQPTLVVALSATHQETLVLNLVRYEFLSRVAEGALPSSFSKECYEDVMSFKSRLLRCLQARRQEDGIFDEGQFAFQRMVLDGNGIPVPREINFTVPF